MTDPDDVLFQQRVRVMQIVAGTLLTGVLVFLVIAIATASNRGPQRGEATLPVVSIVAVVMLMVQLPLAFFIPHSGIQAGTRRIASGAWQGPPGSDPTAYASDTAKLLAVRQTAMIIRSALLEGVAFLGCIAYMIEGRAIALGVVAVAVIVMLLTFPTRGRVRSWVEQQANRLVELRQDGNIINER
jgi:hypothetical protein